MFTKVFIIIYIQPFEMSEVKAGYIWNSTRRVLYVEELWEHNSGVYLELYNSASLTQVFYICYIIYC